MPLGLVSAVPNNYLTERPPWAGLWVNYGNISPDEKGNALTPYLDFIAGETNKPRWMDIEATKGVFDFSIIGDALKRAQAYGTYYYYEFWAGDRCPDWLFEEGVPLVRLKGARDAPYFLNAHFKERQILFFQAMADYLAALPAELRERLAFIQPGFGSTGDRQLYKGPPADPRYEIDSTEYLKYMQAMTVGLIDAFARHPETANIRFLWNLDDYIPGPVDPDDYRDDSLLGEALYAQWMYENYNCQLRKQQFTLAIGYMTPDERNRDKAQRPFFFGTASDKPAGGHPDYVRGEHNDQKWAETPMARKALEWHYYWTAISSVDRGLDSWETHINYLKTDRFLQAYQFSHQYAFHKNPATSPRAFVALRDALDYTDFERFPKSEYGDGQFRTKGAESRIKKILAEYAAYGARNDDMEAAVGRVGSNYILRSQGLNDCVSNIIARNYRRFMQQIAPNETSVGHWRVGPKEQPYGRFARGFEAASGKNALYFALDDNFFAPDGKLAGRYPVAIRIVYFDENQGGQWELRYDALGNPDQSARIVRKSDSGAVPTWREITITLKDANFGKRGPRSSDFSIHNVDEKDDIFHLVEIIRGN